MRLVILESPYRGTTPEEFARNQTYLNRAIRDCLDRGESPYASHAILTRALDDNDAIERARGLNAGHEWIRAADHMAVYNDYGASDGMREAIDRARSWGLKIQYRTIGANPPGIGTTAREA